MPQHGFWPMICAPVAELCSTWTARERSARTPAAPGEACSAPDTVTTMAVTAMHMPSRRLSASAMSERGMMADGRSGITVPESGCGEVAVGVGGPLEDGGEGVPERSGGGSLWFGWSCLLYTCCLRCRWRWPGSRRDEEWEQLVGVLGGSCMPGTSASEDMHQLPRQMQDECQATCGVREDKCVDALAGLGSGVVACGVRRT